MVIIDKLNVMAYVAVEKYRNWEFSHIEGHFSIHNSSCSLTVYPKTDISDFKFNRPTSTSFSA